MGEGEKLLDAAAASGARPEKKPWHRPALRKIDPASELAALFETTADQPNKKRRHRLRPAA